MKIRHLIQETAFRPINDPLDDIDSHRVSRENQVHNGTL